ncbi:MAG: outer membrane beta-barrel protein [Pseudomonadota bacterium]
MTVRMTKRMTMMALAITLAGTASLAQAGGESGFYLGGSVGNASLDISDNDPEFPVEFDDEDMAYKGFAGYNIGVIPMLNLAVEGAYVNFGTYEGEIAGLSGNEIDVDGFIFSGLVGFDLGPIGLFGKMGMLSWDNEISSDSFDESDSGTDPAYGVGAKFQIGSIAVRAEYEMFDLDDADIDFYSVGAAFTF